MWALAAIGVGMQAYSMYEQGRQRSEAAKQDAKFKRAQATEMLERLAIEEVNLKQQGEEFKAKQTTGFAGSGVALGAGATLLALEDTQAKITQKIQDVRRDTTFRANQLMQGYSAEMSASSSYQQAGSIGAAGSLLQGGYNIYKNQ